MNNKILKSTELTGIIGRSEMEKMSTRPDWSDYREGYNKASNLEHLDFPIQIDFELNSSCNLHCPMCELSSRTNKRVDFIELDYFRRVMTFAVAHGTKAVKLNYINEPLLRSDFFEFVKVAEEVGIVDIYFSTNGMLLTEKNIDKILNSSITRVQISIDAIDSDTYDTMRPGGNYETLIKNIKNLLSKRVEYPLVRVNFVKTELNEHQVDEFIKMWEPIVDMIGIQEFVQPPSSSMVSTTSLNKKELEFQCSFPFKQLVITASKQVLPCCTFWGKEMSLGTLDHPEDLLALWNSPLINHLRNIHTNGEFFRMYQCRKCLGESL